MSADGIIDEIIDWKARTTVSFDPIKKYINFSKSIERFIDDLLPNQDGGNVSLEDLSLANIKKKEFEFDLLTLEVEQYLKMLDDSVIGMKKNTEELLNKIEQDHLNVVEQCQSELKFFGKYLAMIRSKQKFIRRSNQSKLDNKVDNKHYYELSHSKVLKKEYQKKIKQFEDEKEQHLEVMNKNNAFVQTLQDLLRGHENVLSKMEETEDMVYVDEEAEEEDNEEDVNMDEEEAELFEEEEEYIEEDEAAHEHDGSETSEHEHEDDMEHLESDTIHEEAYDDVHTSDELHEEGVDIDERESDIDEHESDIEEHQSDIGGYHSDIEEEGEEHADFEEEHQEQDQFEDNEEDNHEIFENEQQREEDYQESEPTSPSAELDPEADEETAHQPEMNEQGSLEDDIAVGAAVEETPLLSASEQESE